MKIVGLTLDVFVAAAVLLFSTYITFLGRLYLENGTLASAILFSVLLVVGTCICVYLMCNAKAHKNHKKALYGQVACGVVIVILFGTVASIPFNNFISVWQHKKEVEGKTKDVTKTANDVDVAYISYVNGRLSAYQPNDTLRRASLRRHLLPDGIDSIQQERHAWVESIGKMSPFNIAMPTNLNNLKSCANEWVDEYKKLAGIQYGDEPNPDNFEYDAFDKELDSLLNKLAHPGFSLLALLLALVAAFFMFLPYIFTRPVPVQDRSDLWEDYFEKHRADK